MKPGNTVRAMLLRSAEFLAGVMLVLLLTSCSLGEAVMPSVAPGLAADRSAGLVAPVPDPIPHTLEGRQECFACHAIGAVDAPPVPADHDRDVALCSTCHAMWLAPVIAASAPPAISHDLVGRSDCLTCHKLGTGDAPRVPDNHSGLTSAICQTCHTAVEEIVGVAGGAGAPITEAPSIPHGLDGFGACTLCHAEGGPGIPRLPDDHQGRTDDLCSACHSPAAQAAEATPTTEVAATPTEAPEPTPTTEAAATPTEAPEPTPTTEAVATSTEAPEPTPTAEVVITPTKAPPAAAGDAANGQVVYSAGCMLCHGPNGEGTAIAPNALNDAALLEERTDEDLVTTIREGVADKMPPFPKLSDQEVLDLVAFLRSWQ
jgi:cytochrome c5